MKDKVKRDRSGSKSRMDSQADLDDINDAYVSVTKKPAMMQSYREDSTRSETNKLAYLEK